MSEPVAGLREVDSLEVLVLVDNATDNLSSVPASVEVETSRLLRRGGAVVTGAGLCVAAHGLACLVTVRWADERRTLLFDAGPDGEVFSRNVQRLGADLGRVDAVVLSHGHWDHAGGMVRALDLIRAGGGDRAIPFLAHRDMFHQRAAKRPDGSYRLKQDVPSRRELTMHGADVVLTTAPELLAEGHALVSGEIPRVTSFETGLPGQHRRIDPSAEWEPDEQVLDERFLAIKVRDQGLVVLSACSHAGVINVLTHAAELVPDTPIRGVLGGMHLAGTNERIIPQTVEHLARFDPVLLGPGHCTGWRAIGALAQRFGGDRLVPLSVGKRFTV
jgi:7,8-dihydropterin-6-yl-methyl-4-(beta-D-ribofuranosyl)aminobenzene 5'-phosphate synthase